LKSPSESVPPPSRGSVNAGAFDPGFTAVTCLPFDAFEVAMWTGMRRR
jgi:hypothetical protein